MMLELFGRMKLGIVALNFDITIEITLSNEKKGVYSYNYLSTVGEYATPTGAEKFYFQDCLMSYLIFHLQIISILSLPLPTSLNSC